MLCTRAHLTSEEVSSISNDEVSQLASRFQEALQDQDVVILSDYNKGVLTNDLTRSLIKIAKKAGKLIVADPKGRDFSKYEGVDVLTPNTSELAFATGLPVDTDEHVEAAARSLMDDHKIGALVVTRKVLRLICAPAAHSRPPTNEVLAAPSAANTP